MQMVPVNVAIARTTGALIRRRGTGSRRSDQASGGGGGRVLRLAAEFIDAEFEEVGRDTGGRRGGDERYWAVLFPEFFFKCRYVNYYI